MVPNAFHDKTNLKMYCSVSYVGLEPILSVSEAGGVTALAELLGGVPGLPRDIAVSRLIVSKSLAALLLPVKESTRPKIPHLRFVSKTCESSVSNTLAGSLGVSGWGLGTVLVKWSKPTTSPGCGAEASVRMIMNLLPGAG